METTSPIHDEWAASRPARRPDFAIVFIFGLFCWAPMFLVQTPTWSLYIQPILILLLAYFWRVHAVNNHFAFRKMTWVALVGQKLGFLNPNFAFKWTWWTTSLAAVSVFALMVLAPSWIGWHWMFPVIAAIPTAFVVVMMSLMHVGM